MCVYLATESLLILPSMEYLLFTFEPEYLYNFIFIVLLN